MEKMNECISRSKPWRGSKHIKSSIRSHDAVVPCTMSGWLKKTLKHAATNIDLFKPHSARYVSSSKVSTCRAPLVEILHRRSWFHQSTW